MGRGKSPIELCQTQDNFEEAATVFNDPGSITQFDPDHSGQEERFIDIGVSDQGRLRTVVYTERALNLRIISCRKATRNERRVYDQSIN